MTIAKQVPDDVEVPAKPKRRTFTAAYKAQIVAECDDAVRTNTGSVGAILRREGLYSSHLCAWRHQLQRDGVGGLTRRRGPVPRSAAEKENVRLRKELEQALERARRAELIVDAQKKLCEVLQIAPSRPPNGENGA